MQAALDTLPDSDLLEIADGETRALWRGESSNRKTGNTLSLWVGDTREASKASCEGCPLLAHKECYAQNGLPGVAHAGMVKAAARKGREAGGYTLAASAAKADRGLYARVSQIGDASRLDRGSFRASVTYIRRHFAGVLSYTHMWREVAARGDADLFTASCGSLEEADEALASGFSRATVVLPWDAYKNGPNFTTPGGASGVVCPELYNEHVKGRKISCQECGMCDPTRKGPEVVGFPDHSAKAYAKARKAAKEEGAARWLLSLAGKVKAAARKGREAATGTARERFNKLLGL
jgi:hypothetical protein